MAKELEAKVRVEELSAVRATLERIGAARVGEAGQVNRFFDWPDRRLRNRGCGLRIRTADNGSSLTFKGPIEPGPYKQREELETDIADARVMEAVLHELGLVTTFEFAKHRETWSLDGCQVELDSVPNLGEFVEIEGPTAEAISAILTKLGLADQPTIRSGYVELLLSRVDEPASPKHPAAG